MNARLQQIRALLAETPDDAFLLYALATEWVQAGELERATEAFANLRARHPDYVGLYYHYGATLLKLGRAEAADAVFAEGIAVARAAGDRHALSELQNIRLNASLEL